MASSARDAGFSNGASSRSENQRALLRAHRIDVTSSPYDADPTGTNDSLSAFQAAIRAACASGPNGTGASVWVPAGIYRFSGVLSGYGCDGLTLHGDNVRTTVLKFSAGARYAVTIPENIRNFIMQGFLIVIVGNNKLGCINTSSGAFSQQFTNIYCMLPIASVADGFDTYDSQGTGSAAFLDLNNVRVDNGRIGFHLQLRMSGDLLSCHMCYADGATEGFYINGWFLARLDACAADSNAGEGFYFDNTRDETIIGNGLTSEHGIGFPFYLRGAGAVILSSPKTQSAHGAYDIEIAASAADVVITNPLTVSSGKGTISLDIRDAHSVSIVGGTAGLDNGLSTAAAAYLERCLGCSTQTIAQGKAKLESGIPIDARSCASRITVAAPGVLSTDNIQADFSTNPTYTVGYRPGAMLTIVKYPSAGNVNFLLCNNTPDAVTPNSAVVLNWRVTR